MDIGRALQGLSRANKGNRSRLEDMEKIQELDVPDDTLGLHVLHEPQATVPDIDIVAVHGLGGDSFTTWTEHDCLWLRDLLPKSNSFSNTRIMTFGYNSKAFISTFENQTKGRLALFAEQLLSDLKDHRTTTPKRPIIFVGHSLGGIVIKAALRHANERQNLYKSILDATHAIVFFGTPHQGSEAAVWAAHLGNIGKVLLGVKHTVVIDDLQRWSSTLVDLTTVFSEFQGRFQITTYFELEKLHGVTVVEEGSARMYWKDEQAMGLPASHRALCRFSSPTGAFERIRRRFENIAYAVRESEKIQLPDVPIGFREKWMSED